MCCARLAAPRVWNRQFYAQIAAPRLFACPGAAYQTEESSERTGTEPKREPTNSYDPTRRLGVRIRVRANEDRRRGNEGETNSGGVGADPTTRTCVWLGASPLGESSIQYVGDQGLLHVLAALAGLPRRHAEGR